VIFVDTSAALAVIHAEDERHDVATQEWNRLLDQREKLLTTSYTLSELICLAQQRFGLDAVRRLRAELIPLIEVVWIDAEIHEAALAAVLNFDRRKLSLVDCASFEVMRRRGLRTAFTLDHHFKEQGFDALP
jgi:predicted nucleic acid-binding protein